MLLRGTRYDVSTVGFDENLQLIGKGPLGQPYNVGLRIPSTPTTLPNRYLFKLCGAKFHSRVRVRLVGLRQLLTIGARVSNGVISPAGSSANYILEKEVTSPFWSFQDGNVTWHVMRVKPNITVPTGNALNQDGVMFRDTQGPALLYETYTPPFAGGGTPIGGYVAPFAGRPIPIGDPIGDFGGMRDIRFPWQNPQISWGGNVDVEIEGPCEVAMYASVMQTNPDTRVGLVVPGTLPGGVGAIPQEDAFVADFANAIYWRIAGAMTFEVPDFYPVLAARETGSVEEG